MPVHFTLYCPEKQIKVESIFEKKLKIALYTMNSREDYANYKVCSVSELKNGNEKEKMKLVDLGEDGKCIVVRSVPVNNTKV